MVTLAPFIKLIGLLGCSTLLVNCTFLQTKVAEPNGFRLETLAINYDNLASKPATPISKVFQFSFYDYDLNWKKVIKTVDVTPLDYRDNKPHLVIDNNGREYLIDPGQDRVNTQGKSVLTNTPLNWYGQGPAITFQPQPGTLIIPLLPNHTYQTAKAEIAKTGGKVLGIFGTTFKGFSPKKDSIPLSYVYFNPNRLAANAGKTKLSVYRSANLSGQSAPNILLSGLITYGDGHSAYLDFSHLKGKGQTNNEQLDDIKTQIRKELAQLEDEPEVVAITLDTHAIIRKPEDIEAVVEREDYQHGSSFLRHETESVARGLRVFDNQTKAYLGSMITPSLLMKDCLKAAKQKFGSEAVIQFLDGEASASAYFENYNPTQDLDLKDPTVVNAFRLTGAKGLELIVQYE